MKKEKFGSGAQEFLEDDIEGVDNEMDLISDGPEEEAEPAVATLDPEAGIIGGGAVLADIRIDREREEEEEQ